MGEKYIKENANKGTTYHEAFHVVFNLFLNEKQQEEILTEAFKIYGKDLGITNKWGYIEVDEKMRTNIPGIFGIGDVIQKDLRQIITAASDGSIAAVEVSRYIEKLDKKLS